MDKLELIPGKPVIIKTQVGEQYSVVSGSGDALDLLNNVIVKRVGDDIVLLYPNNIEIVFEDFYLVCLEPEACSINLPAAEGEIFTLTSAELATDLGDGSSLIYVYGNANTLLAMAKDNDALQSLFNSYDDQQINYLTSVEPVETSSSIGLLSSGILGIGALSGMSGDASNAPEVGSVTYDIAAMLGPLIDNGEGSIVSLYKADGTKLGEATFDVETQRFIFEDISSYTGVVIACLQDKDDIADYMDEATVQAKDIPTDLFLVTTVTAADQGQTVSFTITPLSAIAAIQAGVVVADNNVSISANTEEVSSANIAVANAFGLSDIELDRAEVKPTIDSAGVNTINSNTYGQVLALISAWEDATNATENGNDTITYFNNHFSATDLSNLVKAELVSAADIIELPRNEVIKLLNYSPTDSDLLQAIGKYANEIDSTAKNAPGLCAELLNEIEGIDGAVIGNEAAYEEYIVSNPSKFSETATLSEVQSMVHIVNAIIYINKALGNHDMANPSIDHFVNADVTGVNESNLSAINELLTSKNTDAIDTTAEIQSVVNSYNTIFNAANGIDDDGTKPEANDYSTIGVSGVNSTEKVSLMGDILDIKTSSDVDTLAKLQSLVDIVNKIMQHSESTPQLITQNELESIGITNLTSDRTQDLLSKIANTLNDNTVIDTLSEIQAMVDTTAPTASINLDKVTTDDIININEADMPNITITGEVGDDVKEGDMVTLLVNGKTYTGNVLTDNTFSIEVASSDLASDTSISASVTITDTAGNITTVTDSKTYSVDTTPPIASITLDRVTKDNIINASEANLDITINGTVSDDVKAGDTVTLTVDSKEFTGEVLVDKTFSIPVSGSNLAADTSIEASVTTTDIAGNSNTATDAKTYSVDTTPPSASITLDTVSTDNIINASESSQDINITGTVGDDVQEGDAVILTVDSAQFIGEVLADKTFSIAVSGSNLASDTSISASVTTTDTAGNSTTATETKTYSVDTTLPNASITLDTITTDNIINASEANQDITITGTVGDDVQEGDTVTLTVNGQTTTGLVQEDNTFSIAVSGSDLAADTSISANVTTTDIAGNSTSATDAKTYSVDTTAPSASITLDTVATDNIINASESTQDITITGTVGDDVQAGDTVILTVDSTEFIGEVLADKNFSIAVSGSNLAADTSIEASVTTTDTAGNSTTATDTETYSVATTLPSASITLDAVATDNIINASESTQNITITGTVGDDVQAGDTVTLTVNGQSTEGQVNENGTFSIAVAGSDLAADTSIEASVTITDTAGNSTTVTDDKSYSVDTTPPSASITLDMIAMDNIINASEANQDITITGTVGDDVQAGDTVTLTVNGQSTEGQVNENGAFSIALAGSDLADDTSIEASVTTTDTAGNSTTVTDDKSYSVDTTLPSANITLDTIATDNIINASEANQDITITGTVGNDVQEGDAVILMVNSTEFTGEVLADNTFSIPVSGSNLATDNSIEASVTTTDKADNSTTVTVDKSYSVDTTPPSASITLDDVTDDNTINASESTQDITITGTVDDDVQAGDTVTLTVNDQSTEGQVNENGNFSIAVSGSNLALDADTSLEASVTTTDTAGNSTTVTVDKSYSVDTTPPSASITLDDVTDDNTINSSEADQEQEIAITGTVTVDGDVQAGDTVTLTVNDQSTEGQVNENGNFSIAVSGSNLALDADTSLEASVTTTDTAGNSTTVTVDKIYSVDPQAPTLSLSSPKDGEEDVAVSSNIVLTFSEDVTVGNGDIVIYSSDGTAFETIAVTDSDKVTVNDAQVTINPSNNFAALTEYYVQIDTTAFVDLSGNSYAGIIDLTTLNFTSGQPQLGIDNYILTDTTNSGINLNLIKPIIHDGKNYYFLDESGDNNIDTSYYSLDRVTHDALDILLNNGDDTIVTQQWFEGHDGRDDERSVVIDDFTLILPTTAELQDLFNNVDVDSIENGYPYNSYWSSNTTNSETHASLTADGFANGSGDTADHFVIFQIMQSPVSQVGEEDISLNDTITGEINLDLIFLSEFADKNYYYLDHDGDGSMTTDDHITFKNLEGLLNNGDNITVMPEEEVDDDHRSIIIGGIELVLPGAMELVDYFQSGEYPHDEGGSWSANPWDQAENYHLVINWQDNSFGYSELSDSSSYPVIFQVV